MPANIGVLLPRSTEFPAMGFDLLDGLKLHLKRLGIDAKISTESIGFGEDPEQNHARAEKLVLQDDVELIIAYSTSLNAEALYAFAQTANKPIIFLDAGMEVFEAPASPLCYHITLQGLAACKYLGHEAGKGERKVISAISFLDAGYRCSWAFAKGIEESGGSICGNYVSMYKDEEFTLSPFTQLIKAGEGQAVTAAFSSYLAKLFFEHLAQEDDITRSLPFYCSPFMADEQLMNTFPFPGGTFHTAVTWATAIDNEENKVFIETVKQEKNKAANLFHLLGWEAALAAQQVLTNGVIALSGWTFNSPRGKVVFDNETHNAYSAIYTGEIVNDGAGKCALALSGDSIPVTPEAHRELHFSKLDGQYSRWKNNFFCI